MKKRKRYLKYKEKKQKISKYGSWLGHECPACGEKIFLYDKYDAICCISCDVWMESACSDPNCPYCANRPLTPSEALFYEEELNNKKDWRRQNYQHKNDGKMRHERKERNV